MVLVWGYGVVAVLERLDKRALLVVVCWLLVELKGMISCAVKIDVAGAESLGFEINAQSFKHFLKQLSSDMAMIVIAGPDNLRLSYLVWQ